MSVSPDANTVEASTLNPTLGADLKETWLSVIEAIAHDAPQHRAWLAITKPLGLIPGDLESNLL